MARKYTKVQGVSGTMFEREASRETNREIVEGGLKIGARIFPWHPRSLFIMTIDRIEA